MSKQKISGLKKRQARKGVMLTLPFLIFSLIFFAYPIVWLLILTFTHWNFVEAPKFVGLENIIRVLGNSLFWISVWNTLRFLLYYIPMVFIGALLLSLALKQLLFGKPFVIICFMLAQVASGVSYSIIFQRLFSSSGPINTFFLHYFNISIPFFSSPDMAMFSIALMVTWKFLGYYALIFYSGMNAIPKSIYEAADMDGANPFVKFFKVTLPLMNAQIIMVLVLAITISFAIFNEAFIITNGGPLQTTTTPVLTIYNAAFSRLDPSFASTMAIFVALISLGIITLSRKIVERQVEIV
jgi:multiple sugar transport system permease protein